MLCTFHESLVGERDVAPVERQAVAKTVQYPEKSLRDGLQKVMNKCHPAISSSIHRGDDGYLENRILR